MCSCFHRAIRRSTIAMDSLSDLIGDDPGATYLMAAYDDLSSDDYGYFGYKLNADNAVFYWNTETYYDADSELLNEFEMVLFDSGDVRWNFDTSEDPLTGRLPGHYRLSIPGDLSWGCLVT